MSLCTPGREGTVAVMHLFVGARWRSIAAVYVIISLIHLPAARGQVDVRLADGPNPYKGRVEIFKGGVWLSVCRSYVTSSFGSVVCRQLNYSPNGAVMYVATAYGSAPGEILRENVNCEGQTSLSHCMFTSQEQNYDPVYTLGLSCDTGVSEVQPVRLVNGTSPYEGRVEVFKSGVWGTVTDLNYDYLGRPLYNTIAANIVCRKLFGSSYGGSAVPRQEASLRFGVARRRAIHMSFIQCEGNEQFLHNCTYNAPGTSESLEDSLAVICKPECRQDFQTTTGIITSPTEPDFNSSSADCTFVIRQQTGYYKSIQFSAISFEKDQRCRNYIEVHDGNTWSFPLLGERYCGLSLPPPLMSTQNIVNIRFSTRTGYNSFNPTYTSHPKVCDQGLMTDDFGSFTSPGFPIGYPSNTYCVWIIQSDVKKAVIELTFDDFSVGSQETQCQYALVRVYDGPIVDASTVLTTLCGTTLPPQLRSTGSSLTVVLNVFGSLVNPNGFRASYVVIKPTSRLPKGDTVTTRIRIRRTRGCRPKTNPLP